MVVYDKKVKNKNLKSCDAIVKIHEKCMRDEDLAEARSIYVEWCGSLILDKFKEQVDYMDLVYDVRDRLKITNEFTGERQLRKLNKYLSMIAPYTNYDIVLFPTANEAR